MDIDKNFDKKIEELKAKLPSLGDDIGNSCAALTLTSILNVLDLDELKRYYFTNLAVPFSGFGTYISKKGWKGPCGVISGALAAIGIIIGGKEQLNKNEYMNVYMTAIKFASRFEKQFGSVSCSEICGIDLSNPNGLKQYVKDEIWKKKCQHFVLFAIDQVRKSTGNSLKEKWC